MWFGQGVMKSVASTKVIYKDRAVTILLALAGLLLPGLHKFYLRQYAWGCLYLVLGLLFPAWAIARVASVIEAV